MGYFGDWQLRAVYALVVYLICSDRQQAAAGVNFGLSHSLICRNSSITKKYYCDVAII